MRISLSKVFALLTACTLLCCATLPASAQILTIAPSTVPVTVPTTVKVSGTVINSVTGEPLRRAVVSLSGSAQRSAFTDDEGRFAFDDVAKGPMVLQARKPSFFSPHQRPLQVDTSKSFDPIELKLTPSGVIIGQIITTNDEPLERVPVRLLESKIVEGRRRWVAAGTKMSDEDGRFRIPELQPGTYKIAAGPSRSRDLDSLETGYALTYFPNSAEANSAAIVRLVPAQQLELNFRLQPVPLLKVSGVVLGGNAQQTNLQVLDTSDSPLMMPAWIRSDPATGSFEAEVPAGRYNIRAMSSGGIEQDSAWKQPKILTAKTSVTVSKDVSGIVLTLEPAAKIPVIVRKEEAKPPSAPGSGPGILIRSSASSMEWSASVRLISLTDENNSNMAMPEGPPEQRALVVSNVQPGTYEVDVISQGGGSWYVASAQCGSKNLLRESLTVPANGKVDPIEIVMRDDGAMLRGSVRGANSYGELLIVSDTDVKRRLRGNFGLQGQVYSPSLPPGTYTIYAFDHPEEIESGNPEALRPYQSKAAHVTLSANQNANVTMDLIETEE